MAEKRILLLGTGAYTAQSKELLVQSRRWDEIDGSVNVRDYEVLVLNLLSVDDPASFDWRPVTQQVNRAAITQLLFSGGTIIVLGDPRFSYPAMKVQSVDVSIRMNFLDWVPIQFQWDEGSGTSGGPAIDLENLPMPFRKYLQSISRWDYSLATATLALPDMNRPAEDFHGRLHIEPYWKNRYGHHVAFSCYLELLQGTLLEASFGPITFLPRTGLTEAEIIDAAFSTVDVQLETPEPEWAANTSAPGQREFDEKAVELEQQAREAWSKLQQVNTERAARRRFLGLLYEKQLVLEALVRDAFRELGADVKDPGEHDREDGWIAVGIDGQQREGVLEVKSTQSETFNEDGLRQLEEWKLNGEARGREYKGIFVGSRDIDRRPGDRQPPFSPGWTKSAAKRSTVGLLTEVVYAALALHAEGGLDVDRFWQDVFDADGPLDSRAYLEQFSRVLSDEFQTLFGRAVAVDV